MKKAVFSILSSVVFLCILLASLARINEILMPKYTEQNNPSWPMTSAYYQFYQMERNSVDVIFLGSSVAENAFDPQEIYDSCGIRSYNLGCEQQSAFLSYFWLREALRFQTPRVVVLDSHFLSVMHPESAINTQEQFVRKCLDPMRLSAVKIEAVRQLCALDDSQSPLSYFFTNLRYHTRWTVLSESDFSKSEYAVAPMKGFGAITTPGEADWLPFEPTDRESLYEFDDVTALYLDRIVALCKENNISLLLTSLPGTSMSDAFNNRLEQYAAAQGFDYLNLSLRKHYEAIGAHLPEENAVFHQNVRGAAKTSRYVGRFLADRYHVPAVTDPQYESSASYHAHILRNAELTQTTDSLHYLDLLCGGDYVVLIASSFDVSGLYTDAFSEKFRALGLQTDLSAYPGCSYYAVLDPENGVTEAVDEAPLTCSGSFRGRRTFFTINSGDYRIIDLDLITIDGEVWSADHLAGLHIVVYDPLLKRVIDAAVCTQEGLWR